MVIVKITETRPYRHPLRPARYTLEAIGPDNISFTETGCSAQGVLSFLDAVARRNVDCTILGGP